MRFALSCDMNARPVSSTRAITFAGVALLYGSYYQLYPSPAFAEAVQPVTALPLDATIPSPCCRSHGSY